jgi:SAM-dependent methyltransferase
MSVLSLLKYEESEAHKKIRAVSPSVMRGEAALIKVLSEHKISNVLDIGGGKGAHWKVFSSFDKKVAIVDPEEPKGFDGIWIKGLFPNPNVKKFVPKPDLIWCSHCLEHQPNPNQFLRAINSHAPEDAVIAITVPPLKDEIVGGHVTLWNAGLLLYNMILAGFDCKNASVKTINYDISVVVKKKQIKKLPSLNYDSGDIEKLSAYFPFETKQGFDGRISSLNW